MSSSTTARKSRVSSTMGAPRSVSKDGKSEKSNGDKTHKRSRSGCYICRLRRKKCNEGKPACKACLHLGLQCSYTRPIWWSVGDKRRQMKEEIKNRIRNNTAWANAKRQGKEAPPGHLCSAPTSESQSDSNYQSRAPSLSTPYSPEYAIAQESPDDYFAILPLDPSFSCSQFPMISSYEPDVKPVPFDVDIRTEREIFVNDVPMRRDSTISSFSAFQPPTGSPNHPTKSWVQREYHETQQETFSAEELVEFDDFELPYGAVTPTQESLIEIKECDKPLLNHFLTHVSKLFFPVMDADGYQSAQADIILPTLEMNEAYLHCCLSIAATHLRSTIVHEGDQPFDDIITHRCAAMGKVCEILGQDSNHVQPLEATLGMTFFQCSVGRSDEHIPDVPWHEHFKAATELARKLALPSTLTTMGQSGAPYHPNFNMTLTAWIDILGSTMRGQSPSFADTYRELNIANSSAGLAKLMGCEDQVMFLISEMACLEARKLEGMEEVVLCNYVEILGNAISLSEAQASPDSIKSAISPNGALRPEQLSINITCVFRIAARIYLCTMIPGFNIGQQTINTLVNTFVDFMDYIPAGPEGFDRSLIWPLLVAGSVSLRNSPFRPMFAERVKRLGDAANFGSFGKIRELFKDIWMVNDTGFVAGDYQSVHWRDAMQQKGWDALLI